MVHIIINQYLQQVYEATDPRDGASCVELVSFKHPHVANPWLQLASAGKYQQVLEPPYDKMFAAHLRCIDVVGNHDFIEAHNAGLSTSNHSCGPTKEKTRHCLSCMQ